MGSEVFFTHFTCEIVPPPLKTVALALHECLIFRHCIEMNRQMTKKEEIVVKSKES